MAPAGSSGPSRDPRTRNPWLTPATAGIAVAAVALGAAAVWFVQRDEGPDRGAQAPATALTAAPTDSPSGAFPEEPAPGPSATGSPTGSPTGSASGSPTGSPTAPAGYRVVEDPAGFTIAVPSSWRRDQEGGGASVFYRPPDRSGLIQVFRVTEPGITPCQAVDKAAESLDNPVTHPNYVEHERGRASDGDGCQLDYEYDSAESGGRRRTIDLVYTASDGNLWAVIAAGPAAEWSRTVEHHAAALRFFRP
ncbi:hypothetical protein [Streptomyces venezuelae]|uniref:hypothetical protein n=1 Tax=Streptomyces venezuelae TaxID=54571 RepID=UPI00123B07FE|nr:hypothetical protein [Streptomyces venezuelae]